jgi:iron complex transport system substrate-binding protein
MKKLTLNRIWMLVFLLLPVAAAQAGPAAGTDSVTTEDKAVTATDFFGRTLTLSRPADRFACLYAFTGHVVTLLGRGHDMVAVVDGLKKDRLIRQRVPGIDALPIPAKGGVIHIETLLKTAPDVVFLKPETAAAEAETRKLERFGLPYFVAGYRSMEEQMTTIEMMGKICGRYDAARAYTDYYRNMIHTVTQRTGKIPKNQRVRLYHSVNEALRTDAPGTIEADWTRAAGVINVSVGDRLHARGDKFFAGMEQILIWNPEVIIVNEAGVDQEILQDKKWAAVKAVRKKNVFPIPVGISRWGHPGSLETPLAILWTAKTVYPDLFSDIDLEMEIKGFYHQFFDLTLTDEMVQNILSNQGMRQTLDAR